MPRITVVTETETYSYDQCDTDYCVQDVHDGDVHVDCTGAVFNTVTGEWFGHDGE